MKIKEYCQGDCIAKIIMLSVGLLLTGCFLILFIVNLQSLLEISFAYTLIATGISVLALLGLFWFGYHYLWRVGRPE
ncbi:hypothetical protein [Thalassotalea mangrovi]|uniref:Uncharacterized protein n=1 Tax=Thalassotalea mangrovi TaxID=2572245 RepID=A0A4U1B4Y0_9GAMM|nr:hypothetical protein [Thalassotalea mangrovi]TKB44530.1 hypothetical protein E8M12_11615 [Thalassotalea mangrovi]